jgi:hypothetical protein
MFVHSPSEFYLKYLISHPDGLNNKAIRTHMDERRLVCGPDVYLDKLRAAMSIPQPFFPSRPKHEPSRQFLLEEQIYGLWYRNEHTKMAVLLLTQPTAQEALHAMLTVGADFNSASLLIDKRFGIAFSVQSVNRYKKYFWNTDLVNTVELRHMCHQLASGTPPPIKSNPLVLASELPATPMSAALIQLRLGFMPSSLSQYEAMKSNTKACAMRMYEALMVGGKAASEEFRNYAWGMKYVAELMESMTAPEEDLKKMLSTVELVTNPTKTPTINDLTGGNFSDGSFVDSDKKEKKK